MEHTDKIIPDDTTPPVAKTLEVTDSASAQISTLLADEPEGTVFRISVLGGGCSGFQYNFDLDTNGAQPDDLVVTKNNATVAVDEVSLGLMEGSVLDYVVQMVGSAFEIRNPNATAGCGCGNSFSV